MSERLLTGLAPIASVPRQIAVLDSSCPEEERTVIRLKGFRKFAPLALCVGFVYDRSGCGNAL